ncbi:SCO7613 C-terminal domain-containing membrane protein [Streptomyces sp. NPDC002004]
MTNIPPPAEELRLLDLELRQLDARRAHLLARRAWLLGVLQAAAGGPVHPAPAARVPETSRPGVQNTLLLLGGVLLTVAAIAFTLVSWGRMGITGRALVLGAITLAAAALPPVLLRRGLRSTAETVAGLALTLTVLDAYAVHQAVLPGVSGTGFAAVAAATLAALWAAYGLALALLRLPRPAALAAAQLPLLLGALAADAGPHTLTAALLLTAAFDTVVALHTRGAAVRVVALTGACGSGSWGALAAGWLSWSATGPAGAARAGALLLLAAVIAGATAWRAPGRAVPWIAALSSGLLAVAAAGGVLRTVLPAGWAVLGHLACAVALLTVVRAPLPWPSPQDGPSGAPGRAPAAVPAGDARPTTAGGPACAHGTSPVRQGLVAASATVQGLSVLWTLPVVMACLIGPAARVSSVWSGTPVSARAALAAFPSLGSPLVAPLVLASCAAVLLGARHLTGPSGGTAAAPRAAGPGPRLLSRPVARTLALVAAWAAVLVLPPALRLPYGVGVTADLLATALLLVCAGRAVAGGVRLAALVTALLTAVSVSLLSLAVEEATLGTFAALMGCFAAIAVRARTADTAGPRALTGAVGGAASLTYAMALAVAGGGSLDLRTEHTALLVVLVPAAAALLAGRLGRHPLTVPAETAGAVAGAVAVGLAAGDAPMLALVLALCGVIAAGTAVRPDRRGAGFVAAALFVAAAWVRLAAWGTYTPEAYALPVTVCALVVGGLRRRRDPGASSWTAYAAGLGTALLPSLVAAWGDPHWLRPLLLGTAALMVTLVGARRRLQAPLVLGGTVLALVALHELAPYIVQVVGTLPRWLPPALAGLLLLGVGATYEQRMRDARRIREALRGMR